MKKSLICKGCWDQLHVPIVLRGPLSIPFRIVGLAPSRMNPNICTMCEKHFSKIIRIKEWGKEQITIEATVLFADVRGYTSLSEVIESSQIGNLLSSFYESCASVIWEREGIINKLIGDGVLALFNWPMKHENHAREAVMAGFDLQEKWLENKPRIVKQEGTEVAVGVGVGIHSGNVTIGELSKFCKDYTYTAFGPVVNLAARLQGIAKPREIVVTEDVYHSVRDDFPQVESRLCNLKGIEEPVSAYVLRS